MPRSPRASRAPRTAQATALRVLQVEGVLARCQPLVRQAAALVVGGRLVAAVEPGSVLCARDPLLREAAAAVLALHARRELPAATVPAATVLLERMPLTPTGKLDRIALAPLLADVLLGGGEEEGAGGATGTEDGAARQQRPSRSAGAAAAPRGALECAVADVWRRVLEVSSLRRRSDFLRLGGDSIRALQVSRPSP